VFFFFFLKFQYSTAKKNIRNEQEQQNKVKQ